jgi:hypothetical protein
MFVLKEVLFHQNRIVLFILNQENESYRQDITPTLIYECRCDERLKTKSEKSTRLTYTGLFGELEHLKIESRLFDEMFTSVMGEYVFLKW